MQTDKVISHETDDLRRSFQNPPVQYRGTPFWAWNCDMTKEKAVRVLTDFQKMGMAALIYTAGRA